MVRCFFCLIHFPMLHLPWRFPSPPLPLSEADLSHLSLCAMWFGWRLASPPCLRLAPACNASLSELSCLTSAAALVHEELQALKAAYSTSYEQDRREVDRIADCQQAFLRARQEGGPSGGPAAADVAGNGAASLGVRASDGSVCGPDIEEWGDELQVVLRHRMGKKVILDQAIVRLQEGCMEPMEEDGEQQSPKEAHLLDLALRDDDVEQEKDEL